MWKCLFYAIVEPAQIYAREHLLCFQHGQGSCDLPHWTAGKTAVKYYIGVIQLQDVFRRLPDVKHLEELAAKYDMSFIVGSHQ